MQNRIIWALVGLNVVLLVTLAGRLAGDSTAVAQVRRPSDYLLIPGEVTGGSNAVVYVIDTGQGQLGALSFDPSVKQLTAMAPIDLARVFETGPAAPGTGAGPGARPRPR